MDLTYIVCFLAAALSWQVQVSKCDLETYTAAVVEYDRVTKGNEEASLKENLYRYQQLAAEAARLGADIIVFPEGGLSNLPFHVPLLGTPCRNGSNTDKYEAMKNLSCIASDHAIYMVVNVRETREVVGMNGAVTKLTYNTNVVFDRIGRIATRYAKYNLFDEMTINKPERPELSFFTTDFDVTFGVFTCFDILFDRPALRLIKQLNITNFIFPSQWFSELPFLTALQVQRGWSEVHNVNLLASGFNNPGRGSSGSGIFNGAYGSLVHHMSGEAGWKLLVAQVPVSVDRYPRQIQPSLRRPAKPETNHVVVDRLATTSTSSRLLSGSNELFLLSDQIELFNSVVVPTGTDFQTEVCSHGGFCCRFRLEVNQVGKNEKAYSYRAVAFDGVRKFGVTTTGGVQVCGVVLCVGPSLVNCTMRPTVQGPTHEFLRLDIEGDFAAKNSLQFPTTLVNVDESLMNTLEPHQYEFVARDEEGVRKVKMTLDWPVSNLQSFAVWGRVFNRDGRKPNLPLSGGSHASSGIAVLVTSLALAVLSR